MLYRTLCDAQVCSEAFCTGWDVDLGHVVTDEILKPGDNADTDTLLPMGQGQEFSADLYQSNGDRQQYRVYCKPGYVVTRGPPINNSPNFDLDEHGNPKNYLNIECRSKNGEIPGFKPVVEGYKCGTQLDGDVLSEKNTCDYRDEPSTSRSINGTCPMLRICTRCLMKQPPSTSRSTIGTCPK